MTERYRVRIRRDEIEIEVESTDRDYVDKMLDLYLGPPSKVLLAPDSPPGPSRVGGKSQILQEFINRVKPASGPEHVVAITYFAEKYRGQSEVRTKEISDAFRTLKYKYSNSADAVAKAKAGGLLMDGPSKGSFVASRSGEQWVEAAMKNE